MASSSSARPHSTPMPVGPHILWPENATKSAPELDDVGGEWGTYWQASTDDQRAGGVGRVGELADRREGAEHVRHGRQPEQLGAVEQAVEVGQVELAVVGRRGIQRISKPFSAASWCHGTMLAWCSSWVSTTASPAPRLAAPHELGHQVEALGGVLGEDDLVGRRGADEAGDLAPGALHRVGGLLGERVDAAVRRWRWSSRSRSSMASMHLARLLRRGGRVEVDERACRATVLGEEREVGLDRGDVERVVGRSSGSGGRGRAHAGGSPATRRSPRVSSRSASSGPPHSTIRPSTRMWTTSGLEVGRAGAGSG